MTDRVRSAEWYQPVLGFRVRHKGPNRGMRRRDRMRMAFFSQPHGDRIRGTDRGIAIAHLAFAADAGGFFAAHGTLRKPKILFGPPEESEIGKPIWFMDLCRRRVEMAAC